MDLERLNKTVMRFGELSQDGASSYGVTYIIEARNAMAWARDEIQRWRDQARDEIAAKLICLGAKRVDAERAAELAISTTLSQSGP